MLDAGNVHAAHGLRRRESCLQQLNQTTEGGQKARMTDRDDTPCTWCCQPWWSYFLSSSFFFYPASSLKLEACDLGNLASAGWSQCLVVWCFFASSVGLAQGLSTPDGPTVVMFMLMQS